MDKQSRSGSKTSSKTMKEITDLYNIHNPQKVSEIPALVKKYGSKKLLNMIKNKYVRNKACTKEDFEKRPPAMKNGLICSEIAPGRYAYRAVGNMGDPMANWRDHCRYLGKPFYKQTPDRWCMLSGYYSPYQRDPSKKKPLKYSAIQESEKEYWRNVGNIDSLKEYDKHVSRQTGISLPPEILKKLEEDVKKGNPYGKMRKKTSKKKRKPKKKSSKKNSDKTKRK